MLGRNFENALDRWITREPEWAEDDDVVDDGDECPECGECRMDYLVWDADGETVKCATCGHEYDPTNREE